MARLLFIVCCFFFSRSYFYFLDITVYLNVVFNFQFVHANRNARCLVDVAVVVVVVVVFAVQTDATLHIMNLSRMSFCWLGARVWPERYSLCKILVFLILLPEIKKNGSIVQHHFFYWLAIPINIMIELFFP